jgi:hypothetical protein
VFISTVLDVAFGFSVFGFLAMHTTLVLSNTTTIEMHEKKRITPWRSVVLVPHETPLDLPVVCGGAGLHSASGRTRWELRAPCVGNAAYTGSARGQQQQQQQQQVSDPVEATEVQKR